MHIIPEYNQEASLKPKPQYHLNLDIEKKPALKTRRDIYLIDDDVCDLTLLQKSLSQSNRVGEIHAVNTADKLFDEMKAHGYFNDISVAQSLLPIILMDVHMPTVNGIEMLALLKDHPMTADLPVILLSGDVSGQKIHEAYCLQANGYLEKPFDMKKFHKILSNIDAGIQTFQIEDGCISV